MINHLGHFQGATGAFTTAAVLTTPNQCERLRRGLTPVAPFAVDYFPQPTAGGITRRKIYIKVGGRGVTRDETSAPRVISGLEAVTSKRSACANRVTL